jgi:transposase
MRPNMRFVRVKSGEKQGAAAVFRVRERHDPAAHADDRRVARPAGRAREGRAARGVDDLRHLDERIAGLDAQIARRAREDELARRLMTIPGIGPLIATALATLAPPPKHFRRARDFAAWLGLTPRQHSTGGKQRLGATTRMGERSLRRLLILGANSVVIKRQTNPIAQPGTWLGGLLARKPGMLVRVALANKLARIVWALMARGGVYRAPVAAA